MGLACSRSRASTPQPRATTNSARASDDEITRSPNPHGEVACRLSTLYGDTARTVFDFLETQDVIHLGRTSASLRQSLCIDTWMCSPRPVCIPRGVLAKRMRSPGCDEGYYQGHFQRFIRAASGVVQPFLIPGMTMLVERRPRITTSCPLKYSELLLPLGILACVAKHLPSHVQWQHLRSLRISIHHWNPSKSLRTLDSARFPALEDLCIENAPTVWEPHMGRISDFSYFTFKQLEETPHTFNMHHLRHCRNLVNLTLSLRRRRYGERALVSPRLAGNYWPHLRKLHVNAGFRTTAHGVFIGMALPGVEELTLHSNTLDILRGLALAGAPLTKLTVSAHFLPQERHAQTLGVIGKFCPQLKTLNIPATLVRYESNFRALSQLTTLYVHKCEPGFSTYIPSFKLAFPNLSHLTFDGGVLSRPAQRCKVDVRDLLEMPLVYLRFESLSVANVSACAKIATLEEVSFRRVVDCDAEEFYELSRKASSSTKRTARYLNADTGEWTYVHVYTNSSFAFTS